jgi:hypothetical protein
LDKKPNKVSIWKKVDNFFVFSTRSREREEDLDVFTHHLLKYLEKVGCKLKSISRLQTEAIRAIG